MISRRDFLKLAPTALAGSLITIPKSLDGESTPLSNLNYTGSNLKGWNVVLGDALYNRPPEPPVTIADIQTVHPAATYSELRANIKQRIIMAHNITYKKFVNPNALDYIHTCAYTFRLPYLPVADSLATLNGQTIEGGIFIWDGPKTRFDYGAAFQWVINPWLSNTIRTWDGTNWIDVGLKTVDTAWHTLKIAVDFRRKLTSLTIDGKQYPSQFSKTAKPNTWGNTTDARFQIEIVSIYPEPSGVKALHKAQVKNWSWLWEPVV
ncbi:MAG: twin-arginine translocation signal domain-containing protein [Anaerolineales bacterium]